MREIKFRGICKNTGKFVYGGYSENTITAGGMVASNAIMPSGCYGVDVIPESVGEYTGLKDSNGVEIYEGDIVGQCSNGRFWVVEWGSFGDTGFYGSNQINSCRRLEPGPYIGDGAILEITENETLECIVIGNIHENPELLK